MILSKILFEMQKNTQKDGMQHLEMIKIYSLMTATFSTRESEFIC